MAFQINQYVLLGSGKLNSECQTTRMFLKIVPLEPFMNPLTVLSIENNNKIKYTEQMNSQSDVY